MKTYIPKKPCIHGHMLRYKSNGQCVECKKVDNTKWNLTNKVRRKALSEKWYKNNVTHKRMLSAKRQQARKSELKEIKRKWYEQNKAVHRALIVRYRIQKARATPVGLTDEEKRKIDVIYSKAKHLTDITGIPHEVDHYYPLRGKTVSGLHVSANLRVVPASENRHKYNRVI